MPNRWLALLAPSPKRQSPPKPAPSAYTVMAGDREITVTLRRNPRAKRYTLRLSAKGDGAVVSMPKRGTVAEARAFVDRHLDWIAHRLPPPRDAAAHAASGGTVPLRGVPHRLRATGAIRGVIRTAEDPDGTAVLLVPGEPAHIGRRVTEHLKRCAKADFDIAVRRHAEALGVRPTAIRLKDTTSRWGSASTSGILSFSWRLAMAPPFVLDYLAAHEVAHLKEMNHSDRFWAICYRLAPRTDEAKAWLQAHGRDLHRAI